MKKKQEKLLNKYKFYLDSIKANRELSTKELLDIYNSLKSNIENFQNALNSNNHALESALDGLKSIEDCSLPYWIKKLLIYKCNKNISYIKQDVSCMSKAINLTLSCQINIQWRNNFSDESNAN